VSTPQNTIVIVYHYDQTLSPSYMQDEVIFPAFGIDGPKSWTRCPELVRDHDYDKRPNTHLRLLLEQIAGRIVQQCKFAVETSTVRAPKH
jgi:hypothetical protein